MTLHALAPSPSVGNVFRPLNKGHQVVRVFIFLPLSFCLPLPVPTKKQSDRKRERQKDEDDDARLKSGLALSSRHHASRSRKPLNRRALPITESELRLIASAATIGSRAGPPNGSRTPAARGTPSPL